MDVLALLLYALLAGIAFGWRTWDQWRETGDTGLRLHAEPWSVQWWAKLGFIAALTAGVTAPIAGLAGLGRIGALDHLALQAVGVALVLAGIGGTVWSQLDMGRSWRIGVDDSERTELITSGVFGMVRNPIFTAMIVAGGGLMLMVSNVIAIVGFLALVVALEVQVRRVEEPYLLDTHGDRYAAYARRTGRFVPGLGRSLSDAAEARAEGHRGPDWRR